MKKQLDARGLACPEPVLRAREIILAESPKIIEIIVDNQAARENVTRFLGSQGYAVSDHAEGEIFRVIGQREAEELVKMQKSNGEDAKKPGKENQQQILVLIMTDTMGKGDDELGHKLMINYIKTLNELGRELWQLVFVNGGVRLTCKNSPVIEELKKYEENGTIILSCGTCMEHLGLTQEKGVGGLTNMLDIVMAQQHADKVITIG